jgi:hypothetical protein
MVELAGTNGVTFDMYEEALPELGASRCKKIPPSWTRSSRARNHTAESSREKNATRRYQGPKISVGRKRSALNSHLHR